ncbi:MAG: undecaprenyl-diphosphate phosphatase [Kiritimatiellae bacterium]|nr:undecaprenyl-diphosphate phosphatase [Kiritimatiellia bacterium]
MSELVKVLVLAVVQGVTEFLPVSSSGHLVLGKLLLGLKSSGATLEVALHGGTLLAVLVFYRRRILALACGVVRDGTAERRYALNIVLASVPAAAAAFLLKPWLEHLFDLPGVAAGMLIVTGLLLLSLRLARKRERALTLPAGFAVGIMQALAIVPGISRSGSTISLARHLGIAPREAVEFSLLLSIPALLGACLLKGLEAASVGLGGLSPLAVLLGIAVAALVGYAAIGLLVRSLLAGRFWLFGIYCCLVGIVMIVFRPV